MTQTKFSSHSLNQLKKQPLHVPSKPHPACQSISGVHLLALYIWTADIGRNCSCAITIFYRKIKQDLDPYRVLSDSLLRERAVS